MTSAAYRYAKALFDLAVEKNNVEDVHFVLNDIKNGVFKLNDFRGFLNNPLLDFDERKQVLKALFEGKIAGDVYTFLLFVAYKNRLNILEETIDAFDALYLSHTRQMRVVITTAFPIQEEDKTHFKQHLEDKFKKRLVAQWQHDHALLGGFRMYAQGTMYDYSFKNQLNDFYQQTIHGN